MGVFDKTICDCCVCPMQSILKQLEDRSIMLRTIVENSLSSNIPNANIQSVEGFVLFTDNGNIPVHSIFSVGFDSLSDPLTLKQPKNEKKGKCACIEDPATNMLSNEISNFVIISGFIRGTVSKVGEGIVMLENVSDSFGDSYNFAVVSTCSVGTVQFEAN
ncbi:hypothetical protein [Chengkuizengella axinellae]|uniref:Uncharacterized protein n=1 Tax=Chengkuizengella axinellae TaxID=3064388 RepID=A0ABT9J4D9_9BACL|nr:hypothetical protein [Chengkuizengella sp. 2205SS18-9]MDP5276332.1 hypothetical protein [Chengkuizengella sp. 2205SS18-9]